MSKNNVWETVCDESFERVRRLRVENGWLYQVQSGCEFEGYSSKPVWHAPVFVPDKD